jgi:hypothetical protein
MNSRELQPDQTLHSHWGNELNPPNSIETTHSSIREKILENDRKKRLTILFSSCFIIASIIIVIALFSFKTNPLEDSRLVDNIDLLSNNEEINFYDKMEFYQWLDLAVAEKSQ